MGFLDWFRGGRANAPTPETPEELFTREVTAAFQRDPQVTSVVRGTNFDLIVKHGDREWKVYLGNMFAETRDRGPDARADVVKRFVFSLSAQDPAEESWDEARGRLVPVLRASTAFQEVTGDASPISRPFAPFLIWVVGIDYETTTSYVNPTRLKDWGITAEEAFAAAQENAAATLTNPDVELYDSRAAYRLWHIAGDDGYVASRLLLPGWLASFRDRVNGRPIAIVPQRSMLMVGGDGDDECVRRMLQSARNEYIASPRSISLDLYTVDEADLVVPLVLSSGHPHEKELVKSRVDFAGTEYKNQKDRLEKELKEDVFVASFGAIASKDGKTMSFSTWGRGIPTLLPETDLIAMGDTETKAAPFLVRWATARAMFGDCLQLEPGLNPPRWRTMEWPSAESIKYAKAMSEDVLGGSSA